MDLISTIEILPLILPIVKEGDDVAQQILEAILEGSLLVNDGDIFVIAHTIISRAEGQEFYLPSISPSPFAELIARKTGKDPSLVELIVNEAEEILKVKNNIIITKTHHGWICANSAIDQSNAQPNCAVSLPKDSNKSAKNIGKKLTEVLDKKISVLISDTHGRALRRGAINIAVGAYNFSVIDDAIGREDIFGYKLKSTIIALADEVCSAAELIMGQANEKVPVVLIKGLNQRSLVSDIKELQFEDEKRLFQ
ncbi:MAG: coenzyme F420-0:L-glutamate ligase [Candidatus Heimdallarchaeota archaeon]|nr:coenzyme F420-0:L-glutamate ligase [Candidatus Heimdallarchaeota archaeon]MCK4954197.1 coenzyme F420-0:L-glutamate ligase [Candidatus Heimdallarchaeota archaeon]